MLKSEASTLVILLLCAILWLAADFYGEYKKNNLTEQEKSELIAKESNDALVNERRSIEIQKLMSMSFSEVEFQDKPTWIFEQLQNSLAAKLAIASLLVGGFGFWFIRRTG